MPTYRLLLLLLCFSGISACDKTMPAVHMTFIDEANNQPIVGANIIFHANAYEGTISGHGGKRSSLFLLDSVTNEAGEIHFPAQEFWPYPFIFNTNYNTPTMFVFKSGYEPVKLRSSEKIFADIQDMTTWQHNNKTIKMRRISADKDIHHSVDWAATFADQTYRLSDESICLWKKMPLFLVTVHRAVNEWNQTRHLLKDEKLRRFPIESPLESLLDNEKYYTEKGCGSPKLFFEPYLR